MRLVIQEGSGEWSALYVDGRLDEVGDHYYITERVYELLGVEVVQDDAFMRGQDKRDGVAQTLGEVEAYRQEREVRQEEAAQLEREAAKLIARAKDLRQK